MAPEDRPLGAQTQPSKEGDIAIVHWILCDWAGGPCGEDQVLSDLGPSPGYQGSHVCDGLLFLPILQIIQVKE